jgi:hypothetical protein
MSEFLSILRRDGRYPKIWYNDRITPGMMAPIRAALREDTDPHFVRIGNIDSSDASIRDLKGLNPVGSN